jgi:hypothetical protein
MNLRVLIVLMSTLLIATLAPARLMAQLQINLSGVASKAQESAEITLDSSMLQLAGNFLKSDTSDKSDAAKVKELISGLKAITVRNYKFAQEGQYRPEDLEPVRAQLRGPGWSKVVGADNKANGETSEIYLKSDQSKIVGVAILNAEPKELSVVYIEGTIDLAGLARLGGSFGIPAIPGIAIPDQKKGKGKQ